MPQKKARKHVRAVRKGYLGMEVENEGEESYKSGVLWNISLNISQYL